MEQHEFKADIFHIFLSHTVVGSDAAVFRLDNEYFNIVVSTKSIQHHTWCGAIDMLIRAVKNVQTPPTCTALRNAMLGHRLEIDEAGKSVRSNDFQVFMSIWGIRFWKLETYMSEWEKKDD